MPQQVDISNAATGTGQPKLTQATRVDPAHTLGDPINEASARPIPAEDDAGLLVQQLRTQAAQLGSHLRDRQASIDHREAELNARLAELDNQVRSARLWLSERQEDLSQRIADVERRAQEVQLRAVQLSAREASLESRSSALETAEEAYEKAARQRKSHPPAASGRGKDSRQGAAKPIDDQYELRCAHLDAAEALLSAQQAALEEQRQQLTLEGQALREQLEADRCRMAEEHQFREREMRRRQEDLKQYGEQLDARRTALEQLQAEMSRAQREVLEMRLVTEQLWAQLCAGGEPATLTQSMSQIRRKLADHDRLMRQELIDRKAEVQQLSARVGQQHEKLRQDQQQFQDWMARRQQEAEAHATALVEREQSLSQQQAELDSRERAWAEERFNYQQEIRRLLRQLRQSQPTAV